MVVTIVKSAAGNLGSVVNMLKRIGGEANLTSDPAVIEKADKLLLPGVGAFDPGMQALADGELVGALNEAVCERGVPVLGICLGMQLLADSSEEGRLAGLGWIPGKVTRLSEDGTGTGAPPRVPHLGWNTIRAVRPSRLLGTLEEDARFYFAHTYRYECEDADDVVGTTVYGCEFASVLERDNIYAAQFHPEKSHRYGMQVLSNFLAL